MVLGVGGKGFEGGGPRCENRGRNVAADGAAAAPNVAGLGGGAGAAAPFCMVCGVDTAE